MTAVNTAALPVSGAALHPRLLSPRDVAAILNVSPRWVYRRALEGELPFAHLGDSPRSPLRADARAIAAWIDARMPPGTAETS